MYSLQIVLEIIFAYCIFSYKSISYNLCNEMDEKSCTKCLKSKHFDDCKAIVCGSPVSHTGRNGGWSNCPVSTVMLEYANTRTCHPFTIGGLHFWDTGDPQTVAAKSQKF